MGNISVQYVQGKKDRERRECLLFPYILWFDNRKWSLPAKTHCYARMLSLDQCGTVGQEPRTPHSALTRTGDFLLHSFSELTFKRL